MRRVHDGEEWAASLERRLRALEFGRMDDSRWVADQTYVKRWWGTFASTSVPSSSVTTVTAWTGEGAKDIADPVSGVFSLPGGMYTCGVYADAAASFSTRAFVEASVVSGGTTTLWRQPFGAAEDQVGGGWTFHAAAGSTLTVRLYQTTGSTVTVTGRMALARIAAE